MPTKPVAIFIFAASIAFSLFGCASTPKEAHETKEVNTAYMSRIDAVVAKDISKTAGTFYTAPVDETKSFSTADNQAVMWVKIKDITGKHTLRWEWYSPNGKLYDSTDELNVNNDGKERKYITAWHKIAISGDKAETMPGAWTVKLYLDKDKKPLKEMAFEIDVDLNQYISRGPESKIKPDKHKWALIIGIEKYKKTGNVAYAEKDAELMKAYLKNFIGVPEGEKGEKKGTDLFILT